MTTGTTTSGDDIINSGSGDNIIDGGAGDDRLNAGAGNDTLIYRLAENTGSTDLYMGGSGSDAIRLVLTEAEWTSATVQQQVALYFEHLETVKRNNSGEVSNGTASDFTFCFDGGTRLTVTMMERLEVSIDGALIDFEAPWTTDDSAITTEDDVVAGSVVDNTTDINQSSATLAYALVGAAPAGLSFNADGTWSFDPAGNYDALDAGDSTSVSFDYAATDADGDAGNISTVTITITGVNDAPVTAADSASTDEDTAVIGTVVNNTTDADDDVASELTYSVVGAAPAGLTFNADGTYRFDPSGSFDHLDTGDSALVTFDYKANDGDADSNVSQVTITVTGVNELGPVMDADSDANAVAENAAVGTAVQITAFAADPDDGDTVTYSLIDDAGGRFTIDVATGVVSTAGALDYESATSHTITVQAGDGDLVRTQSFTIDVSDVVENLAPTNISLNLTQFSSSNSIPTGVFATLSTADADSGDTFTYSLISQSPAGGFSIAGNQLSTTGLADGTSYTLVIETKDSGDATFQETFNIITGSNPGETLPSGGSGSAILSGDDVLYGKNGADIIFGGGGDDALLGQVNNDNLNGGAGNDVLFGGSGNDTLTGDSGADRFKWVSGDQGANFNQRAIDTVVDFDNAANSDKLDLKDLLIGETGTAASLDAYLDFSIGGGATTIGIRATGSGDVTQQIVLRGVDLSSGGTLGSDSAILNVLLANGQLMTDGM